MSRSNIEVRTGLLTKYAERTDISHIARLAGWPQARKLYRWRSNTHIIMPLTWRDLPSLEQVDSSKDHSYRATR